MISLKERKRETLLSNLHLKMNKFPIILDDAELNDLINETILLY